MQKVVAEYFSLLSNTHIHSETLLTLFLPVLPTLLRS